MNSELFEKLEHLHWLSHKQRLRRFTDRGHLADTSQGQGRILAVLKLRDGISTKDLAYLLGVRVSSLNELLSKLEKNGYVTREASEQDKRVMLVKLTEKGREEEQRDIADEYDLFAALTEDEQASLSGLLDKVIDALQAGYGEDGEDMAAQMEALHERLGDFRGGPFGRRFHGYGGMGFDNHGRAGFEHIGRGEFAGRCDFRGGCGRRKERF